MLEQLRGEIAPDHSQYGGMKKCGVELMLVDLWEEILLAMEGGKTIAVLLGIDYEKAFNRMEHAVCLAQLEKQGASAGSLSLVRAFLEERKMTIIIDGHEASPVAINRGSPQGSVLGCFLYCVTTQSLTKNLRGPSDGLVYFPQDGDDDRGVEYWEQNGKPGSFHYVDDTTLFDSVSTDKAVVHLSTATAKATFQGLALERDLAELKGRVEEINMKINAKKTQLLVISPPNGYDTSAVLRQEGEEEVWSVDTLKLVGFTFGLRPGAAAHLEVIHARFRRRVWMLYNLRDAGFKGRTLYRLYCCYIRSIVEYCSVVYHHMLTLEQEKALEKLHRLEVKICFGFQRPVDDTM